MTKANLLYAQFGGVIAVVDATASAVIESVRQHSLRFRRVFAARSGIIGVLREESTSLSNRLVSKRLTEHKV